MTISTINGLHDWINEELFDSVPMSICVIDRQYRIITNNRMFTACFGDGKGQLCHKVYKGKDEKCLNCVAARTFIDGKIREREEDVINNQGDLRNYIVHLFPVVLSDTNEIPYIVEMSTDISELKKAHREKLQAERLATVGQTVAGLAHGIKNIVMGLEGGIYVASSAIERGDEQRLLKGWSMLEENIRRISAFAKDFLEFAKGRKLNVQLVQPNAVAGKVIDLFHERAMQAGIELKSDLQEDLSEAPMDEEGIHDCLTNLVLNAIDACMMSTKKNCHVVLSTRERDGVLSFEVSDDGCGMDYEIKKKVFTNFFSTKSSGKGTGLGLLRTRKIVQEHGGKAFFDSTAGEGSVFSLEFPRDRLPSEATDSLPPEPINTEAKAPLGEETDK